MHKFLQFSRLIITNAATANIKIPYFFIDVAPMLIEDTAASASLIMLRSGNLDLLQDVLPVETGLHQETVRQHVMATQYGRSNVETPMTLAIGPTAFNVPIDNNKQMSSR